MNRRRVDHGTLAIGTVGPAQLLTAFALAHARSWPLEGARVFHIWRGDEDLLDTERWLCEVFGARLTGRLGDLRSQMAKPIVPFGNAPDRIARRLVTGLRARLWARRELRRLEVASATRAILPYRVSVEDALLGHSFRPHRLHYVADGLGIGFSDSLRLPTRLRAWGVTNPFRRGARPEIWGPASLQTAIFRHGQPRLIPDPSWEWTLRRVHSSRRFQALFRERLARVPCGATCLLLQSFSESRLMSRDDELNFYRRVIAAETERGRSLVVKPHPRDDPDKIEALRRLTPTGDVTYLDSGSVARLPIELLADLLAPARLIGICSSALFTVPIRPGREVVMYDCEHLPAGIRAGALEAAREHGITVVCQPTATESGRKRADDRPRSGPGAAVGHPPRDGRASG
ncbi:MAG TPA: polysialyltransferase family glycosyltransferase [Thermoanaerobaculia bacterium]|nr:polysialyltransferase family glycosyltransferase [Thermoanaerobaculia bacterium]